MSGFLDRLAAHAQGRAQLVTARRPSRFEPEPAVGVWSAGTPGAEGSAGPPVPVDDLALEGPTDAREDAGRPGPPTVRAAAPVPAPVPPAPSPDAAEPTPVAEVVVAPPSQPSPTTGPVGGSTPQQLWPPRPAPSDVGRRTSRPTPEPGRTADPPPPARRPDTRASARAAQSLHTPESDDAGPFAQQVRPPVDAGLDAPLRPRSASPAPLGISEPESATAPTRRRRPAEVLAPADLLTRHVVPALVEAGLVVPDQTDGVRLGTEPVVRTGNGADVPPHLRGGQVHVHIGRVEVHQAPSPQPARAPEPAPRPTSRSRPPEPDHDAYLARRQQGRR